MPGQIPLWKKSPFIRILLPFAAGIIISRYIGNTLLFQIIILLVFCCCCFNGWYAFTSTRLRYKFKLASGACLCLSLIGAGFLMQYCSNPANKNTWYGNAIQPGQFYLIKIEEPLQEKTASFKAIASVQAMAGYGSKEKHLTGNIICYFRKDSLLPEINYGDLLIINSNIQPIVHNGNPGSFNYAQYCALNGLYHQSFIKTGELWHTGINKAHPLHKWMYAARIRIVTIIQKNIQSKEAQGLAEALLIGYKYDLDKGLLQAYTNTGVVHVIAISGLHLGLIYLILVRACKFIPTRNQFLKGCIIIAGLWIFSALAGGSPSVLRSAAMFTIIIAGEWANRKTFSINSLAASAFVLLCYSPNWLWDTGFQLSYVAVLGLICLSAPIYKAILLHNPVLDYLWKMNAVTIAATILTLPLTIYYFHQFPVLFILTNSVIIPLSSIILILLIILCCISFLPVAAQLTGNLCELLIQLMNNSVYFFNEIPASVLKNLQISLLQTALLFLLIYLISFLLIQRKKKLILPILFFMLVFCIERSISFYTAENQRKLIVYNINGGKTVEIISGREAIVITNEQNIKDDAVQYYTLIPAHIRYRIKKYSFLPFPESSVSLTGHGKNLAYIPGNNPTVTGSEIIIITGSSKPGEQLLSSLTNKTVVLDNSVSFKNTAAIKLALGKDSLQIIDIRIQGAFVKNLQLK